MIAMFGAVSVAFSATLNRSLKTIPTPIIIFYHACGGILIALTAMSIKAIATDDEGSKFDDYSRNMLLIALGASFMDSVALFCFTLSYQLDSSGFVAIMTYMRIVYAFMVDTIIYHQAYKVGQLIASFVIVFVAVGIAYYKLREK